MSLSGSYSRTIGIGLAVLFLAGCDSFQNATPEASSTAVLERANTTKKVGALLYATGGCGGVCVLTYPEGKLKAKINLVSPVGGDCGDGNGNIFVTNDTKVLEYAHGGTTPIATLSLPAAGGVACGVDSKTGNLAVVFGGGSAGNIAVFADATGSPTVYAAGTGAYYCGYDNHGNLYVSGSTNGSDDLVELSYGGSTFEPLTVDGDLGGPGQVQWDGTYVTVEGREPHRIKISRISIAGSVASVVSTTHLKGAKNAHQSWIATNRVILPYSTRGTATSKISIWRYPKSGKAVVKFGDFGQSEAAQFLGVALSNP